MDTYEKDSTTVSNKGIEVTTNIRKILPEGREGKDFNVTWGRL